MTVSIVSTTAQLIAVLHGAVTGDVIKLAPGVYSNVNIYGDKFSVLRPGGESQVYIESEFASRPAVLTDFKLANSQGLAFVDLKMSTAGDAIGPFGAAGTIPFNIYSSGDISFRSVTLSGASTGTLANTMSGINIENSTYVTITDSSFSYLHNAIQDINDSHVIITENHFSHIYDDGVRGGGTSNVNISGNNFTDFHSDPTDTDHPDLIQFWTTNETKSASNITINSNTFVRGTGGAPQGIFIRDQVGYLPYHNVTAEYNNFAGTLWNGIYFGNVVGGVLDHNIVTSYRDYNSSIDVYSGSRNVLVEHNSAESFQFTGSSDLTLVDNVTTPPIDAPVGAISNAALAAAPRVALVHEALDGFDSPSAAPEPGSWALANAGLALIGAFLRRKRTAFAHRA